MRGSEHVADQELVARDPGVPGLGVLLDDAELAGWLALHTPAHHLLRRRYLRYKPGTSAVLGLDVRGPDGPVECSLTAVAPDAAPKLAKTARRAPDGTVLATDDARLLQLAAATADRDLPALAALARDRARVLAALLPDRDLAGATLTTLSHKPQRRWVGLLRTPDGPPVLLRVHRPAVAAATVEVLRALAGGSARTPRLLGADVDLGVVAVEHLPGRVLDEAVRSRAAGTDAVADAGRTLALLHGRAVPGLRARPTRHAADAARAAAGAVAGLQPHLAARATALAEHLAPLLAGDPAHAVPCHGDFSLDQVVLGPSGTALVDLDEAARDDPATDLATAAAAVRAHAAHDPRALTDALRAGYAEVRALPDPATLAAHTAAQLLRRAPEPFRLARPHWAHDVQRLLAAAEQEVR